MIHPVVLCGGSGSRLWPLSRASFPKQFLPLVSERSMLQETLLRLEGLADLAAPVVICNQEHRFLAAEHLQQIGVRADALMLEPVGRNTAPAIAIAALHVAASDPDAVLLVLPADQTVADVPAFHAAIAAGLPAAGAGRLVTFGIVPASAETGYGYIQRGEPLPDADGVYRIARFAEKPDRETAEQYVASGAYFWNGGIFLMRADTFLAEVGEHEPEILRCARAALADAYQDLDFLRLGAAFSECPAISVDYAVMERTRRGAVVPVEMGWSDVGSWSSLAALFPSDDRGNVTRGPVALEDAENCFVRSEGRLIAAVGVRDLVVVETKDAVLVAHRERAQDVKKVVNRLQREGRSEHAAHRQVFRPWGSYEGVDRGERFQVKRITVKPGARLSLQMHHHRAEHWVVVTGTAEVTVGGETRLVTENESVYVPLGVVHRLHNPGRIPLHLVEVQSGPYLDEDDIVRIEDPYGR